MNKSHIAFIHFLFALSANCITTFSNAQTAPQTVGVFQNSASSFNGYTLITASGNQHTYLIDNCGFEINTWESSWTAGMMSYLLDDGSLLRCGVLPSSVFYAGA
jgi:hypothetical protein